MLFLAVFCGFLAENFREHQVEKQRGQQYVRSLYDDLRNDTLFFSYLIRTYEEKVEVLSVRKDCYDSIKTGVRCDSCIEKLTTNSTHFPDLAFTDRTLQQLKNAGGLRLLPQADADSILQYDNLLRSYQTTEKTSFQEIQTHIRNTLYSLLNYDRGNVKSNTTHPVFFGENRELINRYFNELDNYVSGSKANIKDMELILTKACYLISYFKNKYHYK
jgi:hypothetical protein